MSLYERDYAQFHSTRAYSGTAELVKRIYLLFSLSLLSATIGAWAGIFVLGPVLVTNMALVLILNLAMIGLTFAISATKAKEGLNTILLFVFTFISGLAITPLLFSVLHIPGGAIIIAQAFTFSAVAFVALSVFAFFTKKDFSVFGKALFITLLVVFAASIFGIFIPSPMFHLVLSAVCAVLFSMYIIYDTQMIVRGEVSSPTFGAIMLYLDFLNLFRGLLVILSALNSRD